MKHLLTITLATLALALLASCASTPLAVKPRLIPPSTVMLRDCELPSQLPAEGLTVAQVEDYWSRDRVALLDCSDAKSGLQTYYRERDRALSGNSGGGR